jgi:release factor glutamine methyltransferase
MLYPSRNTIGHAWDWFLQNLETQYSREESAALAKEIFRHYLHLDPAQRVMNKNTLIQESDINYFRAALDKLLEFVPLQYVIGYTDFLDLRLKVDSRVLIPRPETEELVQWVLQTLQPLKGPLKILDIGAGSGCIALSVACKRKEDNVIALDLDAGILELIDENAKLNDLQISTMQMNILEETPAGTYDVIISNPPYVRGQEKALMQKNVLDHEPAHALFVSDDDPLLFYREISRKAFEILSPGGFLFFEINEYLGPETLDEVINNGFSQAELKKDFHGKDRFVRARKF